jgi:hypothetical protein
VNENDIREQDIDSAAALLLGANPYPVEEWDRYAELTQGRTRRVYRRCSDIARARREMEGPL